jgi:hypothetical protein
MDSPEAIRVKKFIRTKTNSMFTHHFCYGSSRNLGRSCNMWGRGGRLEVHMNLMPPRVSKISFFFHILDLLGSIRAFQIPIFVSCSEKRHIQ